MIKVGDLISLSKPHSVEKAKVVTQCEYKWVMVGNTRFDAVEVEKFIKSGKWKVVGKFIDPSKLRVGLQIRMDGVLKNVEAVDKWTVNLDGLICTRDFIDWKLSTKEFLLLDRHENTVEDTFKPSSAALAKIHTFMDTAMQPNAKTADKSDGESSGGSCDYYVVNIESPTTEGRKPYTAECNDLIEKLGMTFAEANIFKELWRSAAARTLGKKKAGHTELRGAQKIVFFAERNLKQKSV